MSEPQKLPEALTVQSAAWEAQDIQGFRDYLARNGARFLAHLAGRAPMIDNNTMEKAALSGAKHAGFEELFKVLASMADNSSIDAPSPFIGNDENS